MDYISKWFASSVAVKAEAEEEEELVDPQVVLREECTKSSCEALQKKYEECNRRVLSKKATSETCTEELFDFMHCVDSCVAKTLFTKLK